MNDPLNSARPISGASVEVDKGLQTYMRGVFLQMGGAVAVSGLIAYALGVWGVNNIEQYAALFNSPIRWVLMLGPLAIVMIASFGFQRLSYTALQACFWGYAAMIGASFSTIAVMALGNPDYMGVVANAFFAASAAFLGSALFGYVTNRDLTKFGSLLFMAVIGLLVAMVINMFLGSQIMEFIISAVGVLIFTALTAYDTQRLKMTYYATQGTELARKLAVMGALGLYINFVMIFQFLLSLMSND